MCQEQIRVGIRVGTILQSNIAILNNNHISAGLFYNAHDINLGGVCDTSHYALVSLKGDC